MIVPSDSFFIFQRRQIAELAAKNRIPTMYSHREQMAPGGLVSYGVDLAYTYRHIATYVDKILKGAKPGDLPFEQPIKIHLAINRKAAKLLRLKVPPDLLLLADEVIE